MAVNILSTKSTDLQKAINEAPLLPGCYIYKNSKGKIIYIGKAKVLRNRVRSYFNNFNRVEEKIRQMVMLMASVEYMVTDSEVEALILESNLIKKYRPKYNSMMTDDKSYVYVKFDRVKAGQNQALPTITLVREKHDKNADYFGPYPNSYVVKRLLTRLRRIYPYCISKQKVTMPVKADAMIVSKHKPCFYYQINLCGGACAGLITRGEYVSNLNNIKRFFKGEKHNLMYELEQQMKKSATAKDYEQAAKYRNMLNDIKYVGSQLRIDRDIDEINIMQTKAMQKAEALSDLIARLEFPQSKIQNHEGFRIECYDISNIQGKYAVGSMVVSVDGEPRPDLYRRFRIKILNDPNDFAMLQEVLTRRFNQYLKSYLANTETTDNEGFTVVPKDLKSRLKGWKIDDSFSQKPDLMIIDGGKGQLSSVYKILQGFQLADQIPIVGLAKREEEIFKVREQFKEEYDSDTAGMKTHVPLLDISPFIKIRLPLRSEGLYLVQRIRDEAHRFAITYHRKLRSVQFKD